MRAFLPLLLVLLSTVSTSLDAQSRRRAAAREDPRRVFVAADFGNGPLGWTAAFADYALVTAPVMELDSGMRTRPAELGPPGTAFFITGHNRSDDLFMFLAKKLTSADGILPGTRYEIAFRVVVASSAGSGCFGAGGAPGEGLYLKVGATGTEPRVELDSSNDYRVNFDKGQQSQGGAAASVAGDMANGTSRCDAEAPFVLLERLHRHTDAVVSSPTGELWLIVGTDSAYEGKTTLYYQAIEATLTRR